MPSHFFDITDAGAPTRDEVSVELAGDEEARDEAVVLLPDLARRAPPDGNRHELVATVRDERGATVYEARLTLSGRWWPGRGC